MKTSADPVRDYLSAVEREASTLPADRRQELLADLAEHIEVTRAERPEAAIGEILAELGDPRTIAATALAEAGNGAAGLGGAPYRNGAGAPAPAPRGKVHPLVPLLMMPLSVPFIMVITTPPGPQIGLLFRIIGAVLLCTSVHWTAVQKTTGVLLGAVLPSVLFLAMNESGVAPTTGGQFLVINLAVFVLMAGVSGWLWRARRA